MPAGPGTAGLRAVTSRSGTSAKERTIGTRERHHHGTRVHAAEAGDFRLFLVRYRAGTRVADHVHEQPQVGVVFEGEMGETLRGVGGTVARGHALVRPAGLRHANGFDAADTAVLVVEPTPERWAHLAPLLDDEGTFASTLPGAARLERRLLGALRGEDPGRFALEASLLELLAALAAALGERRDAALATRACASIDREPATSSAELARELGVAERQLHAGFRRALGEPLARYRLRRRLERAERLIVETSMPIAAVAAEAGFFDESHLSRVFSREHGVPPGRLRRLRRES